MRRIPLSPLFSSAISLAILSTLFLFVLSPVSQAQNGPILITQHVDETKLVVLAGNTRPEANKKNDRGPVADDLALDHMFLQLNRSPQQEQELLQYIEELQTPSSPNFHHWLAAKEYGERFGLAKQDLDTITRWLESHGLKVNVIYDNGILIDFSGTAGQVRAAFHTEIHQLNVKGVKHIANMSDPQIPAALQPAVVGVVSLHDFKPHTNYKPRMNYSPPGAECFFATCYLVVPSDLATIYNLNPLFSASISGQGQTIVVIEDTDVFNTADWTTFRSTFGLSSFSGGTFTQVHPPSSGTNNCSDPGVNGNDDEAILDAEYASAAAPSAAVELASCTDTSTFGGLIALQNLLNASGTPPAIVSISYGECEAINGATSNAAYKSTYQQAVNEGVSVFVSSGDEGAASCNANDASATFGIGVSAFASTIYNVAVGGTDFGDTDAGTNSTYWGADSPSYGSALSYVPEIPWDDSCAGQLLSSYVGYPITYGTSGFCNSAEAANNGLLTTASGSGGPSGCATGSPSVHGVVGGSCAGWPKPSWQMLVGNPNDSVRDIPDVSLFAANGVWDHYYIFCDSDTDNGGAVCTGTPVNWSGGGGTSFATPIMAGIQALINQKAGDRQGNPNPTYYSLAATEYGASGDKSCNSTLGNTVGSSCIFYDVTQGDMDVNCTGTNNCYTPSGTNGVLSTSNSSDQLAYGTTTGWDFATGIGTVNAANLVNAWPAALSATTTTLTSSENPAKLGDTVTFTATVTTKGTNQPTGTVTFNDGTTAIGTGTLSTVSGAQVATLATSTLPAGTDSITAVYGGDSSNAGSTSAPVSEVVNGDTTTTTLAAPSPNPAAYGAAVTLTATVTTAGTHKPTGTVTFNNGSTSLGMATLNSSQVATLITSALPVGSDSITAVYSGDSNNNGSTSSAQPETINGPVFTVTNTGPTTDTVLAGIPATVYAFTVAPVAPAPNFGATVTFSCSFNPADPTLTNSSCVFNPATIAATASGTVPVTLSITTAGPNTTDALRRRRADNRTPWLPLTLPLAGIVVAGFAGRKLSKHSAAAGLCLSLILLGLLVACGGSSTPPVVVSVSGTPTGVYPNNTGWPLQTAQFTATVNNSSNTAVTWAVSPTTNGGSIDQNGLYTAPTIAAGLPTAVTITATSQADTTKSASASETLKPATVPGTYAVTVTVTDTAANPQTKNLPPLQVIVQ